MEANSKSNTIQHSRRLEALSDGIFAIAATILVLEIKVPEIKESSTTQLLDALKETLPSLIAFVFSFLNILIFWVNLDQIGRTLKYFDSKLTYSTILFLLFISLVPFTTAFVSRYPFNMISIGLYGLVLFLTALTGASMYYYSAFMSKLMHDKITLRSRKKIWKRIVLGPILFAVAIFLGFINVLIPISIYILIPLLFLVMPKIEFAE